MASDEEYVNYNGDDSRDGYHDFTENNNTDQAAGQNHPIERRVPKRTHAGGYSSKNGKLVCMTRICILCQQVLMSTQLRRVN